MKIKATLIGIIAALALTAGFVGLSGTASADPKEPTVAPSPVPSELQPTAKPSAGPEEPAVGNPAYTG
ncbi:hypothetical protein ACIBQX_17790 [Nonomuraea sp. NPDC049714]|jgi:hypothetical protein|uniref:hypothetical protein n=1 Tax=Nonomuraea sp. NPDC049714 TaxID=3364357 RepID=UPI0037AD27D7